MVTRAHKYGNASQVKCFADGGPVHKKSEMKKPEKGGKPKKIAPKNPPGGDQTPGAKGTYKPKKYADGGRVHGAPIDGTPAPGSTTRVRPKPGDRSNDTSRLNPRRTTEVKKAPAAKPEADTRRVPAATRRRLKDNDVY